MEKKKRKYTKKSAYWNQFNTRQNISLQPDDGNTDPVMCGDNYYVSTSQASCATSDGTRTGGQSTSSRRMNRAAMSAKDAKFVNISQGMLPYTVSEEGIDVRDGIELCQKAYANVAIFRNAIDVMLSLIHI